MIALWIFIAVCVQVAVAPPPICFFPCFAEYITTQYECTVEFPDILDPERALCLTKVSHEMDLCMLDTGNPLCTANRRYKKLIEPFNLNVLPTTTTTPPPTTTTPPPPPAPKAPAAKATVPSAANAIKQKPVSNAVVPKPAPKSAQPAPVKKAAVSTPVSNKVVSAPSTNTGASAPKPAPQPSAPKGAQPSGGQQTSTGGSASPSAPKTVGPAPPPPKPRGTKAPKKTVKTISAGGAAASTVTKPKGPSLPLGPQPPTPIKSTKVNSPKKAVQPVPLVKPAPKPSVKKPAKVPTKTRKPINSFISNPPKHKKQQRHRGIASKFNPKMKLKVHTLVYSFKRKRRN